MAETPHLASYDNTPIYRIKAVVQQTGITPATLRAWERRYGVLSPSRSDCGYRLYSERDIAILRWLKSQVEAGMAISSAVALLKAPHEAGAGLGPTEVLALRQQGEQVRSTPAIVTDLLAALMAYRESEAEALLAEAFALYPVETVTEEVIAPVLVRVGERWHRGEATVVQEHFATAFLHRRLTLLFHTYGQPASGPLAVSAAAPGEWHDIGILLVSLALRRRGWRVIHLGPNVPADHLIQEVGRLHPELVCLSATTSESATHLIEIVEALDRLPQPRPRLALGGRTLNLDPELRARFPQAYWASTAHGLIMALEH